MQPMRAMRATRASEGTEVIACGQSAAVTRDGTLVLVHHQGERAGCWIHQDDIPAVARALVDCYGAMLAPAPAPAPRRRHARFVDAINLRALWLVIGFSLVMLLAYYAALTLVAAHVFAAQW